MQACSASRLQYTDSVCLRWQDADGDSSHPLLRMPRGFELLWADESIPREKCLAVWKPVPMPGYVAMGVVCTIGAHAPAKSVVRCVRWAVVGDC